MCFIKHMFESVGEWPPGGSRCAGGAVREAGGRVVAPGP